MAVRKIGRVKTESVEGMKKEGMKKEGVKERRV